MDSKIFKIDLESEQYVWERANWGTAERAIAGAQLIYGNQLVLRKAER